MRYLCVECNYIYDESLWDETESISPWTKLENLWDFFCCPVCWENSDSFNEIIDEVNYISNQKNTDSIESEHFINYEIVWDNLKVIIWKNIHPSGEDHRITQISLYDEYWDFIEEKFFDVDEHPIADFDISLLDDFEVRARCSLHWVWGRKVSRD